MRNSIYPTMILGKIFMIISNNPRKATFQNLLEQSNSMFWQKILSGPQKFLDEKIISKPTRAIKVYVLPFSFSWKENISKYDFKINFYISIHVKVWTNLIISPHRRARRKHANQREAKINLSLLQTHNLSLSVGLTGMKCCFTPQWDEWLLFQMGPLWLQHGQL